MKQTLVFLLCILLSFPAGARQKEKIKVACVGNSVTYGYLLPDPATQSYPAQLQKLLGDNYEVGNFGHSGATLLNKGHRPYMKLPEFRKAVDFKADLVVIHLGLNDTDPRNWPQHNAEFITDYRALIDSFRTANPNAKVWICEMTPIFHDHRRFESGTRDWHKLIQQHIRQIAATAGTGLIDLHTPLHKHPNLFPDALHPNTEGAGILAKTVYSALTGDYGGLKLPATYGSGMVMQRNQDFDIHGTANAGERVTVEFLGEKRTATAAPNGQWSIAYKARPAGGPYKMKVKAKSGEYSFDDIWMGEVWLCSGQSNMELVLSSVLTAREDAAAADTISRVHLYDMPSIIPTYAIEWDSLRLDSVNHLNYVLDGKWERCNSKNVMDFSAIAYNFGRMLADSLGCHIGLISNAVGGSCTENWIDRASLELHIPAILRNWKDGDYVQEWARGRAKHNIKQSKDKFQRHPYEPAYLFEDAILPLERYPIRGVLWYQGESNAHNIELHERLFTMLEDSWRAHWNREDLPFYFVQLSSIATRPSWPHFRDSQRRLAKALPHTWMAVCSDIGDRNDVHPRRKREVAERLLAQALYHTYGKKVVPSGPEYTSFTAEKSRLTLHFNYADGMKPATGTTLAGFEVAGADGIYYPAKATVSGKTVIVESPEVATPCAVRYGWTAYTEANLVNNANLPASTFRDEKF